MSEPIDPDLYESLVETVNILSDPDTMAAITEAEAELKEEMEV